MAADTPGAATNLDLMSLGLETNVLKKLRSRATARAGLIIAALAVCCGLATFVVLTGLTPIIPTRNLILALLGTNLLLVGLMAALIGWQMYRLVDARRRRIAGAGMHIRIVALLSLFAAVPALIVALFATVTLNRGLDVWFSDRTRSIVDTSISVAKSYIGEQADVARVDIAFIANDINQRRELFEQDRQTFIRRLATHAALRSLTAAYVIDASRKRVEASATANSRVSFRPPEPEDLAAAKEGKTVISGPGTGNVIRALVRLDKFPDHYLYAYRLVNPEVVEQLAKAEEEKRQYDQMLAQRAGVQMTFALMYGGVALIFLLAAIWLGLWFADRIVEPIVGLVSAARRVSRGDLDAKVEVSDSGGDVATLGRTFNLMTEELKSQRERLVAANIQLDERRRFSEAVLAGVTAGVIGLDAVGRITLANRSALHLLGLEADAIRELPFEEVVPAMAPLLRQAMAKLSGTAEGNVDMRIQGHERYFVVRVTTERSSEDEHGFVVTFDDMTELVSAQRNSAWADIARRIAHEIKNPLTPIQLSAERLRRKYSKEIQTDPQIFDQCTSTIIRQVGDIGRMVDEFSAFARMPTAELATLDLGQLVKESLVLQRVSAGDITFEVDIPEKPIEIEVDRRLVTQAITNLVKNAREAIEARLQKEPEPPPRIKVAVRSDGEQASIEVADNGIGLPQEHRNRLTEPYMTTREKGTGLGLAIVKRIMEDHGGRLVLTDAPASFDGGRGALVKLIFLHGVLEPELDSGDRSEVSAAPRESREAARALGEKV